MADYQGSVLREGLYFGECPRWHDGRLWYSDFFDHAVHALAPGGADERVVEVAGQRAGLGWMPDGSLLIVSMVDRRVLRLGPDGSLGEHADLASGRCFTATTWWSTQPGVRTSGTSVSTFTRSWPGEPRSPGGRR